MTTYAIEPVADEITWNPDLSPWTDQHECTVRVRRGERVVKAFFGIRDDPAAPYSRLSVAVDPGQRVYLIRTGAECGVIASGYVVAAPDHNAYVSPPIGDGSVCNYILFETLLDLRSETLLAYPPAAPDSLDVNLMPTGSTISGSDDPFAEEWKQHVAAQRPLRVGHSYTRQDLYDLLRVPEQQRGGDWATGYHRHGGDWYVFANVGLAGRTGHDYENRWSGDDLIWRGKTSSRIDHDSIQSMLGTTSNVHVFSRSDDRSPFTYEGVATASDPLATEPVTITWRFNSGADGRSEATAQEVVGPDRFVEGAVQTVIVNRYERDRGARRACIQHWGLSCVVCGFNFIERYGDIGRDYIHVHHLKLGTPLGK